MRLEQRGAGKAHYRMASEYSEYVLGRVIQQEREFYQVVTDQEDYSARVSGKFRYGAERPSDYPAVGDFVLMQCVNERYSRYSKGTTKKKPIYEESGRNK